MGQRRRPELVVVPFALALAGITACSAAEPPAPEPYRAAAAPEAVDAPPPAPATETQSARAEEGAPEAKSWAPPVLPTRSAGCGRGLVLADGTTFTTRAGRTFHVWSPPGLDTTKPYPVVLAYHGWYASGRGFQQWFEMERYVEGRAIVVYPDAAGPVWDTRGDTDLAFFDEMVASLSESHCIDPSRVLAFGFSWGARFVSHLGCRRAGYVKAIAMGGGSAGAHTACGRLPVFVTNRTSDHDEPVEGGRAAQQTWAELNGCKGGYDPPDPTYWCITQKGCAAPGHVTYCEDGWFDASWPTTWNHTVREIYRAKAWTWFEALP